MRKDVTVLATLLVATNAGWAWFVWGGCPAGKRADTTTAPDRPPELRALEERVRDLEAARAPTRAAAPETRPQLEPARVPPKPAGPSPEEARARKAVETDRAKATQVATRQQDLALRQKTWVADALQVGDADKRETTLREIEAAIASEDDPLVQTALRTVVELRSLEQGSARFRPLVLASLGDESADVRGSAAYALFHIPREEGDLERVLERLATATTEARSLLHVALMLNKGRAEGPVAEQFVRFLAVGEDRETESIANLLRSMWVSPEVENAVLAAKERSKRAESGLWPYIFGQMRPTREPRVRAILAWMAKPAGSHDVQLLERAVVREVDPAAKPLAATLALEALPTGIDEVTRRILLQVVVANGTAENAQAVRAFADNPMVGDALRRLAGEAAEELARKH